MSRFKLWDVIWAVMSLWAAALCAKSVLELLALPQVNWLLVLVVAGLGGFVGAIPYLPEKIVNQETAGVWLVIALVSVLALSLWPGAVGGLGFAVCLLVMAIGYFRHQLLSAGHPSE